MAQEALASIKVIGIGEGGNNAINTVIWNNLQWIEFIAADTNTKALEKTKADIRLLLGPKVSKGLGTNGDPELGMKATLESLEDLRARLKTADMVFVIAGLGGGTGTGGTPIVAKLSKEMGAFTVVVVTTPFQWEGKRINKVAMQGLKDLYECSDALILIPNKEVDLSAPPKTFSKSNWAVTNTVKVISDSILTPGMIKNSIKDLRDHFQSNRVSRIGAGRGYGENAAIIASKAAISNSLFKGENLLKAQSVFIIITAGTWIHFSDVDESLKLICNELSDDASVMISMIHDETINERAFLITLIAQFRAEQ